ncbi:UNVERIFIED_CONTAM: hypothetical protein GTU68_056435, partial [Idotea baltica]|nr:hypothetical protein [Idotea baltica]
SVVGDSWFTKPIRLGLDLKGGSYLVLGVKTEIEKNAVAQAIETIRNRVDQTGVVEPTIQRVGEKQIMVQLPEIKDIDQLKKTIGSVAKLEFRFLADPSASPDQVVTRNTREGLPLKLEDIVAMSVTLKLNSAGRSTFGRITSDNIGRQLAIILDGTVQSYPVIRGAITGGTAQITGGFTREEAHQLAVVLRSGALPAPLTFEEERTVGATLGADSIRKGVLSMIIGSVIVILFIALYYKKSGLLAVGGLVLNVLFLLTLLVLLNATLTLPGIAGLILTVGMAVDANVIIFERIREEVRVGASARAAVEAGFAKAHWTILDANITTLLTGIILYGFGTGPIKGFAVTLCFGIITSVFAALYVGKLGFSLILPSSGKKLSI